MLNAPTLQIRNSVAFDYGDSVIGASSWSNLPHDFVNQSFDSDCSKENQIPMSVSSSSSLTTDPIHVQEKPPSAKFKSNADQVKRDIDAEIADVEKEINRLTTKLESLRLEKAEQRARSIAIRGRIVPAKFMESQKQTVKFEGSKSRTTPRRGVSLGPGEIFSASKTPLQSAQNRRKSCFFKLPGIEEGKVRKARGRTSPRSRKASSKITAATTVVSSIQPKRLFKEEEKRKPVKPGRVVASRYSLVSKTQTAEKDVRKRSLPETEDKEKRRASDEYCKSEGRWEIPSEVDETPVGKGLPKIRTLRRVGESPRDSGAAKRVAELESKNRNFTFCQLLRIG